MGLPHLCHFPTLFLKQSEESFVDADDHLIRWPGRRAMALNFEVPGHPIRRYQKCLELVPYICLLPGDLRVLFHGDSLSQCEWLVQRSV